MCIVCFFLGYFVADVISKCGFGREHFLQEHVKQVRDEQNKGPGGMGTPCWATERGCGGRDPQGGDRTPPNT